MNQNLPKKLLASIFNTGAILQRDYPIKVWGWGEPHTLIKVYFSKTGNHLDRSDYYKTMTTETGAWELVLPSLPAGGPYELTVSSEDESITVHDILMGDIWICSGQSNMQLPMARVKNTYPEELSYSINPQIRQFSVPIKFNFHHEQENFEESQWISVHPETTPQFSAVGYFFAKKLYEQFNVPIGLILTAVGGTPIQAWMSREALQSFPEDLALANACQDDQYVKNIQKEDQKRSDTWYASLDYLDAGLHEHWFEPNFDDNNWASMDLCAPWSENPDLQANGSVWLRLNIDVPDSLANQPARLFMGCIVDADYIYVNGTLVGNTTYQYPPREYAISNLTPGRNVIAVRVISCHNTGGFIKDKPYKLVWSDSEISLDTQWKYKRAVTCEPLSSATFFQYKPTGLYNSMIAPLHYLTIKGVIWYQGESNAGEPKGYYERFCSMVTSWRERWKQGDFPFLFVQLANFSLNNHPISWALLREEQRKSLTIPNTEMAVTIDVGEYNDLHPLNKKTVGDRLALAAYRVAYDLDIIHSGPKLASVKRIQNELILQFTSIGSGLIAKDSTILKGFSICFNGDMIPANAIIKGNSVILSGPKIQKATVVRYAWADNPEANLYNSEGLPTSPFSIKID